MNNRREQCKRIIRLIKRMGCCQQCGERDGRKLTFHHRIRKNKKYEIADLPRSRPAMSTILRELEKCDLLCKTCHNLIHNGEIDG